MNNKSRKGAQSTADIFPGEFEEIDLGQEPSEGEKTERSGTIEQDEEPVGTKLLGIPGVAGVALGEDMGEPVVNVYVSGNISKLKKQIPEKVDGKRTKLIKSGEFVALTK